MKTYGALAFFAFAALAFAAVWLGGLNQDEGWYLYAANLVAEGKVPYRDFFFTQGPLMPVVYSAFTRSWEHFGILGARVATLLIGLMSILFATALSRLLATDMRRAASGLIVFLLLGCNLYHVYYVTIPKTYALCSLFLVMGFYLVSYALAMRERSRKAFAGVLFFSAGVTMALSAGVRISLGVALVATVATLAFMWKRHKWSFAAFALGAIAGLAAAYGPFLVDAATREGLWAAQKYHASRGSSDFFFLIGSVSRLVRWYLPVFILVGLGTIAKGWEPIVSRRTGDFRRDAMNIILVASVALLCSHLAAPYPYEDYQVPAMTIVAAWAAARLSSKIEFRPSLALLLTLGLAWGVSFSSPLLEKWTTNGQDRLWTLKKEKTEIAQLREVARIVEAVDPGGKDILTQDLYLAIETGRKVPKGLEMGPFSMLDDKEWRELLESAPSRVAALSGYTFAIEPPSCRERSLEEQMDYWTILKRHYELVLREDMFAQNSTSLLLLKRKDAAKVRQSAGTGGTIE